ncbi:hypothetical protein QF092_12140 [Fuscovulum ytuae]|uniref:Uncharacterized protein n=1 Tax=Fuscovulum ytuae TaxID=3042299 RepID=A0ABY8Q351_9RHOB|nr:hypothetical protein [Fuscovulum sp. YMD61]WGV15037.1 hypothetical protein QF092_12140 [Fuscovulum sp. YMD61]
MLRIGTRYPLGGVGVFDETLTVVRDPSEVQFVVQDAVPALTAAIDGGGVPKAAARAWDALPVQACRNGARRLTLRILLEDPTHDCGLFGIDLSLAPDQAAVFGNAADHPVAIAIAAGDAAGLHSAALAASCLLGQILQKERIHRALEADVQFVDLALGQCDQFDVCVVQPLENRRHVFLVAADPVQRFGEHQIDAARTGGIQQCQHAGARTQGAGADGIVAEDLDHVMTQAFCTFPAEPNLIIDRRRRLQVRGIAGIDGSAHQISFQRSWNGVSGPSPVLSRVVATS